MPAFGEGRVVAYVAGAVMPVRSPAGADTGDARINFAAHQVRANAQGARQDFEEMISHLVTAVRPGWRPWLPRIRVTGASTSLSVTLAAW